MAITDAKDLGKAIKNGQDKIEVEGDLAKKTIKIKATGKVAWGACVGGLAVAIAIVVTQPATTAADVATGGMTMMAKYALTAVGAVPAAVTLGSAATTAVIIGVAGGGVGALNKLRGYRLEKKSDTKIILHKK